MLPKRVKDLTGQRFERLVVISFSHTKKHSFWNCVCDCGKIVKVRSTNLKFGQTKSCGCLKIDRTKEVNTKHGHSANGIMTRVYNIHRMMLQRCHNVHHVAYNNYGGRGIIVCDKWHDFNNFLRDMGEPPDGYEIDRIDNNGIYEKANCRWIHRSLQGSNKRNNINITFNDETLTLSQWSRKIGIKLDTLFKRMRAGWDTQRMLTEPSNYYRQQEVQSA